MDSDLNQIIRSTQPYSNAHIQYFLYQILRGLKYLHSADILHRDLKPSNILVNANCDCKIADFGMSRALDISDSGRPAYMTGYVTTRWYRAPEVILTWQQYSKALDVWSVGCILAELIGRKPIFPGKSYNDQLSVIFDKVGTPSSGELKFIKCRVTRRKIQTIKPRRPKPLRELYPHAARNALSLLKDLIQFVPGRRLNVKQALEVRMRCAILCCKPFLTRAFRSTRTLQSFTTQKTSRCRAKSSHSTPMGEMLHRTPARSLAESNRNVQCATLFEQAEENRNLGVQTPLVARNLPFSPASGSQRGTMCA